MNTRWLKPYVYGITLLASALLAASSGQGLAAPFPESNLEPLVWLAAIALVAELMAVNFRINSGEKIRSSLAFLPFLIGIILFPTQPAVAMIVGVSLVSQVAFRKAQPWRVVFNASQGALSGIAASLFFHSIQVHSLAGAYEVRDLYFALGFAGAAATFFLVNMLLSSVALGLLNNTPVGHVFRQVIGPGGANLWYDLLATPIALVPVVLYREDPITGMLVILLPLLLIQYSYLSKLGLLEANNGLLRALVKAIDTRDPYTHGHSVRVASLARAIASDMGIRSKRLTTVDLAALLHDIGKIDPVFTAVLSKPYGLSDSEKELIRSHPSRGAELLESMRSVPKEVVGAVRSHHERYDGEGYPDGLSGTGIPVIARIIMVCDSIDAMLSDRPYRRALDLDSVRRELQRCSGTQFDPSIVDVVLKKNTLERAVELVTKDVKASGFEELKWS